MVTYNPRVLRLKQEDHDLRSVKASYIMRELVHTL